MTNQFLDNVKDSIKASVTMYDLCQRFGLKIERNDTIKCPFHNDAKPSCKIYPRDRGYYCFVCHSGGDVIDFTQKYLGMNNADTLRYLAPFAGVEFDNKSVISEEARKVQTQRQQELKRHEEAKESAFTEYHKWLDLFIRLDKWKRDFAPTDIEHWDTRYDKAVKNLPYVMYRLELAEDGLREFR